MLSQSLHSVESRHALGVAEQSHRVLTSARELCQLLMSVELQCLLLTAALVFCNTRAWLHASLVPILCYLKQRIAAACMRAFALAGRYITAAGDVHCRHDAAHQRSTCALSWMNLYFAVETVQTHPWWSKQCDRLWHPACKHTSCACQRCVWHTMRYLMCICLAIASLRGHRWHHTKVSSGLR